MTMIVAKRMWWHSIVIVFALAHRVDQCCSTFNAFDQGKVRFEVSYFSEKTTERMRTDVATVLKKAIRQLESSIVKRKPPTLYVEGQRESPVQPGPDDLSSEDCLPRSMRRKHSKKAGVCILVHFSYKKTEDKVKVVDEVRQLGSEIEVLMKGNDTLWGINALQNDSRTQVGLFITRSEIPLGNLRLCGNAWKMIRKVVEGETTPEVVNFDATSRKQWHELPDIFGALLSEIDLGGISAKKATWVANFKQEKEATKGVLFVYDDPTMSIIAMDLIGTLKEIMLLVFETLCNAIVRDKMLQSKHASSGVFKPFAFIFNHFTVVVLTNEWQVHTDNQKNSAVDVHPAALEGNRWWNVHEAAAL